MKNWLNDNPITALMFAVFVIVALVGGVLLIVGQTAMTYEDYQNSLAKFAVAIGVLGVGKGLHSAGKAVAGQGDLEPEDSTDTSAEQFLTQDEATTYAGPEDVPQKP